MKKVIITFTLLLVVISLAACSQSTPAPLPTPTATFSPLILLPTEMPTVQLPTHSQGVCSHRRGRDLR